MYNSWSGLDMALCLQLALVKDPDDAVKTEENVRNTLRSLAKKTYRQGEEELAEIANLVSEMEEPVSVTRRVVDNFYDNLVLQDAEFEEEPETPAVMTA